MFKHAFYILITLILVKGSDENECNFTIEQLNGKTLKIIQSEFCDGCFQKDVRLFIQSDLEQKITLLGLQGYDAFETKKVQVFKPASQVQSKTIDKNFELVDESKEYISTYKFIQECQTKQFNGKLTYNLLFRVKIGSTNQFFELNNGYNSAKLITFGSLMLFITSLLVLI